MEEQLETLNAETAEKVKQHTSVFLPNNIQINPDDVKIRYNDLTIGKLLGHGK